MEQAQLKQLRDLQLNLKKDEEHLNYQEERYLGKWQDKKVLEIGSIFEAKHGFFIKPGLLPTRFDNPRLKGIEAGLSDPR